MYIILVPDTQSPLKSAFLLVTHISSQCIHIFQDLYSISKDKWAKDKWIWQPLMVPLKLMQGSNPPRHPPTIIPVASNITDKKLGYSITVETFRISN